MCNQPLEQIDVNYMVNEKGWGWAVGGWRCQLHGLHAGAPGDQCTMGWGSAGWREVQITDEGVHGEVETK